MQDLAIRPVSTGGPFEREPSLTIASQDSCRVGIVAASGQLPRQRELRPSSDHVGDGRAAVGHVIRSAAQIWDVQIGIDAE